MDVSNSDTGATDFWGYFFETNLIYKPVVNVSKEGFSNPKSLRNF
jgi:hypothetical protein